MNFYIDPTERREGTRIPENTLAMAIDLPGLEAATGADWLITPYKFTGNANARPGRARLLKHLKAGGVLIQRKSGGDFISSVPDLKHFQARMSEFCYGETALLGRCWLLITSIEIANIKNKLMVVPAGKRSHGISYAAAEGALIKWKLRGGNVDLLGSDDELGAWLNRMIKAIGDCKNEPAREYSNWEPMQKLVLEPENWTTTGSAFPPGVGRKKLESLANELGGDKRNPPPLVNVIKMLTAGRVIDAKGWGKKLQSAMFDWWGLPKDGSRYIADLPRFKSITIKFDRPLPFEIVDGDGIEQIDSVTYKFSNYEALDAVSLMLRGVQGMDKDVTKGVLREQVNALKRNNELLTNRS